MRRGISFIILIALAIIANAQDYTVDSWTTPPSIEFADLPATLPDVNVDNDANLTDAQIADTLASANMSRNEAKQQWELHKDDALKYRRIHDNLTLLTNDRILVDIDAHVNAVADASVYIFQFGNFYALKLVRAKIQRYNPFLMAYNEVGSLYSQCLDARYELLSSVKATIDLRASLIAKCKTAPNILATNCSNEQSIASLVSLSTLLNVTLKQELEDGLANLDELKSLVVQQKSDAASCFQNLTETFANVSDSLKDVNVQVESALEVELGKVLDVLKSLARNAVYLKYHVFEALVVQLDNNLEEWKQIWTTAAQNFTSSVNGTVATIDFGSYKNASEFNATITHTLDDALDEAAAQTWAARHLALVKALTGLSRLSATHTFAENVLTVVIVFNRDHINAVVGVLDLVDITDATDADETIKAEIDAELLEFNNTLNASDVDALNAAQTAAENSASAIQTNLTQSADNVESNYQALLDAQVNETQQAAAVKEELANVDPVENATAYYNAAVAAFSRRINYNIQSLEYGLSQIPVDSFALVALNHKAYLYNLTKQYIAEEVTIDVVYAQRKVWANAEYAHKSYVAALNAYVEAKNIAISNKNESEAEIVALRDAAVNGTFKTANEVKTQVKNAKDLFVQKLVTILKSLDSAITQVGIEVNHLEDALYPDGFTLLFNLNFQLEAGADLATVRDHYAKVIESITRLVTNVQSVNVSSSVTKKRDSGAGTYDVTVGAAPPPPSTSTTGSATGTSTTGSAAGTSTTGSAAGTSTTGSTVTTTSSSSTTTGKTTTTSTSTTGKSTTTSTSTTGSAPLNGNGMIITVSFAVIAIAILSLML